MQVYYANAGTTDWQLLDASKYAVLDPAGVIYLLQSAVDEIVDEKGYNRINVRIRTLWQERIGWTSAELLKSMVRGLGLLDTFSTGLSYFHIGNTAVSCGWDWGFSSFSGTYPGPWTPSGTPDAQGLANAKLPGGTEGPILAGALARYPDHIAGVPSGTCPRQIDVGNYWWGNGPSGGTDLFIGTSDGVNASCKVPIFEIYYPSVIARLPANTTIVNAYQGFYVPPASTMSHMHGILYQSWNGSNMTAPGGSYDDYGVTTVDTTDEMQMGFGLLGYDPAVDSWQSLGSYVDVDSGNVKAGLFRVIKCNAFFGKLLALKNTRYSRFAVFPCPIHMAEEIALAGLNGDDSLKVAICDTLKKGWCKYTATPVGTGDYRQVTDAYYLSMPGEPSFTGCVLQFKLSDEYLRDTGPRLVYENYPSMV